MPYCDQCGAENPDWANFCDQCGNRLIPVAPQPGAPAAAAQAPAAVNAPADASLCPQCGSAVIPGEAFCDECGAPLLVPAPAAQQVGSGIPPQSAYPAPQPVVPPPVVPPTLAPNPAPPPVPAPSAPPAGRLSPLAGAATRSSFAAGNLLIPARSVSLPLPAAEQVVIGRTDAISGVYPDIDLTPYEGIERGVGRRHVRLTLQQGQAFIEDLSSTNGTYLNGQRIPSRMPYPINSSDELRLGTLVLRLEL